MGYLSPVSTCWPKLHHTTPTCVGPGLEGGKAVSRAVLLLTLTAETLVLCADTRLGNQRCWPVRVGVAVGAAT